MGSMSRERTERRFITVTPEGRNEFKAGKGRQERQLLREVGQVLDIMEKNGIADGATIARFKGVFPPAPESDQYSLRSRMSITNRYIDNALKSLPGSHHNTTVLSTEVIVRLAVGSMYSRQTTDSRFEGTLNDLIRTGIAAYRAKQLAGRGSESSVQNISGTGQERGRRGGRHIPGSREHVIISGTRR